VKGRPLCLLRQHTWGPHPALEWPCVRQCSRCLRVEERCFMGRKWRHVKHLSGLNEPRTRALVWRRKLARELNEQLQRRGDPRAIW
jgi:hypothetical protein